jgi:hypothetical protein
VSNDFAFLSVAKNKDVVMVVNEIWMAACLSVTWCFGRLMVSRTPVVFLVLL